jgi:hypothetical protein
VPPGGVQRHLRSDARRQRQQRSQLRDELPKKNNYTIKEIEKKQAAAR